MLVVHKYFPRTSRIGHENEKITRIVQELIRNVNSLLSLGCDCSFIGIDKALSEHSLSSFCAAVGGQANRCLLLEQYHLEFAASQV